MRMEDSNLENAKIDEFFRTAYGRRSNEQISHGHHSVVDTILGNIGEPLRVSDGGDGDRNEDMKDNECEASKNVTDIGGFMC